MKRTKAVEYKRLSGQDRERISRWLVRKRSMRWIARKLGRSPSTISREIGAGSRNRWTYRATVAEKRSLRNARKRKKGKFKLALNDSLRRYVHAKLRLHWSPEQIVQSLMREYPKSKTMRVSTEAIYAYLFVLPRGELKRELLACLRRKHRRRHRRQVKAQSPRQLEDMLSIEERPKEVADRTIPGHWEGDLLVGKNRQSAIGTLVERTTRAVLLVRLKNKQRTKCARRLLAPRRNCPARCGFP